MGKNIINELIPYSDNIKKLISCDEASKLIFKITLKNLKIESDKDVFLNTLEEYYKETHSPNSEKMQTGRVWFLVKNINDENEVLQVGQAIDFDFDEKKGFFYELKSIVEELYGNQSTKYWEYGNHLKENDSLCVYELIISKYLEIFAPNNFKEIIYMMAREYYAEASVAYFTQAKNWNFYNSGMDKRSLYQIHENIDSIEIDKQK